MGTHVIKMQAYAKQLAGIIYWLVPSSVNLTEIRLLMAQINAIQIVN